MSLRREYGGCALREPAGSNLEFTQALAVSFSYPPKRTEGYSGVQVVKALGDLDGTCLLRSSAAEIGGHGWN